jgi:hypothetical protein
VSKPVCPDCGGPLKSDGFGTTLLGYSSPPGHDHDINCRTGHFNCGDRSHARIEYSIRTTCPAPGCDWRGKEECWCHPGKKRTLEDVVGA